MPIPNPTSGEAQSDFTERCMGNSVMKSEYADTDQRYAVCSTAWRNRTRNNSMPEQSFRIPQLKVHLTGNGRRQQINGIEYAVYPVVLIVEGVHHGSIGDPVYYPASIIEDSAADWNGMPLPVHHPRNNDGEYVLCSDPHILQEWSIGYVDNVHWNDGKLRGEVFVNVQKCNEKHPALLTELDSGGQMEVSTGLLALEDGIPGIWGNENYSSSITQIVPDHLALLPGGQGACSWDDGCGLRTNTKEDAMPKKDLLSITNQHKANDEKGINVKDVLATLAVNEVSHEGIFAQLRDYIDSLDEFAANGEYTKINFVVAVFDNYFVYRQVIDNVSTLFKQNYSVGTDDKLELSETVVQVVENVSYTPVTANQTNTEEVVMPDCCPKKVEALIANEHSAFTEDDRTWLTAQNESHVDKMLSMLEVNEPENQVNAQEDDSTGDVAALASADTPVTLEDHLAAAPPAIRAVLNAGMRQLDSKRAEVIAKIKANDRNTFTDDQLKAMELDQLESIAALAQPATFVGQNNADGALAQSEEEPYVPKTLSMGKDSK